MQFAVYKFDSQDEVFRLVQSFLTLKEAEICQRREVEKFAQEENMHPLDALLFFSIEVTADEPPLIRPEYEV